MDSTAVVRAYYDALDDHDYDRLGSVLAAEFEQVRPDLTLSGRDRFVRFMREERPDDETTHVLDATFTDEAGDVAAEGRLLTADGDRITSFVDVFSVTDGTIQRLRTYTR